MKEQMLSTTCALACQSFKQMPSYLSSMFREILLHWQRTEIHKSREMLKVEYITETSVLLYKQSFSGNGFHITGFSFERIGR